MLSWGLLKTLMRMKTRKACELGTLRGEMFAQLVHTNANVSPLQEEFDVDEDQWVLKIHTNPSHLVL